MDEEHPSGDRTETGNWCVASSLLTGVHFGFSTSTSKHWQETPCSAPSISPIASSSRLTMPSWSKELPTAPWSKSHDVKLKPSKHYEAVRESDKGSNNVPGHVPLQLVETHGEVGRRAGTYGVHLADEEDFVPLVGDGDKDWEKNIKDTQKVVSVRDVKKASVE